jgi:putative transcriptional regulator
MQRHHQRTGERLTYQSLARRTGLSRATLESLASRRTYNTRLSTIEKLCRALDCHPGDLLELDDQKVSNGTED